MCFDYGCNGGGTPRQVVRIPVKRQNNVTELYRDKLILVWAGVRVNKTAVRYILFIFGLYCSASTRCAGPMFSSPAISAIVEKLPETYRNKIHSR
jgi:hypothetical protein